MAEKSALSLSLSKAARRQSRHSCREAEDFCIANASVSLDADPCFAPILLRGFALRSMDRILGELQVITAAAPFRRMVTPGGFTMSVAMTNCGAVGWVTDRTGYRYDAVDPASGEPWPSMPDVFREVATTAAAKAGFEGFVPDACLINRYEPGTKLSLHQDKDERDFGAPVVSVSLGLPARFLFGGLKRSDPQARIPLGHGDVIVWGGAARLAFHGVMPLDDGTHPVLGRQRINLTFRKAR
jgi:DNA oxidative demethylase